MDREQFTRNQKIDRLLAELRAELRAEAMPRSPRLRRVLVGFQPPTIRRHHDRVTAHYTRIAFRPEQVAILCIEPPIKWPGWRVDALSVGAEELCTDLPVSAFPPVPADLWDTIAMVRMAAASGTAEQLESAAAAIDTMAAALENVPRWTLLPGMPSDLRLSWTVPAGHAALINEVEAPIAWTHCRIVED